MTLPRLVLLLALQMCSVHSFSPPITITTNKKHNQQCTDIALQLQQSTQSSPSIDVHVDVNMIESKEGTKEISFEQNAKPMYDGILQAMPWFIRKLVQKNMNNAIAELCSDDDRVTEDDMYDIIAKITPAANLQDSLNVLDGHKTVTATAVEVQKLAVGKEDMMSEEAKLECGFL